MNSLRTLSRAAPRSRCIVVMTAEHEADLRRSITFAAPTGMVWQLERSDDPHLSDRIFDAIAVSARGRKLRTTLDRMNLGLAKPSVWEGSEHRRLIASDLLLGTVLRHASDAIVSVDWSGRVQTWNEGARRMFQVGLSGTFDLMLRDLFEAPDDVDALVAKAAGQGSLKAEWSARVDGKVKLIEATLDGIRDDDGRDLGVLAILRDVTAQRRNEQELVEVGRRKDEFLAMLAHELRNPLSPIRSAAEILSLTNKGQDPRIQRASEIISRQVQHLTGLVDDLLDVARVTRGTISLDRRSCPIGTLVAAGIEQARSLIDLKRQTLKVHVQGENFVHGDPERLVQVFANLVNNAAKYTCDQGTITVAVSADETRAKITVSDTGIGMDANLLPRVFDLFSQGERTADRAQGGLGIGLSLVKSLVDLHGGEVVASSPGRNLGSNFTVELPRVDAPTSLHVPPTATPFAAGNRLRLMVVDDNVDAGSTLAELLEAQGHEVDVQHDPLDALAKADETAPDVFILDIGMPRMNGYELAQRLRRLKVGSHAVFIALTGYGQPEDRLKSRQAGFDHHLVKPLDAALLSDLLESVVPAVRH